MYLYMYVYLHIYIPIYIYILSLFSLLSSLFSLLSLFSPLSNLLSLCSLFSLLSLFSRRLYATCITSESYESKTQMSYQRHRGVPSLVPEAKHSAKLEVSRNTALFRRGPPFGVTLPGLAGDQGGL